MKKVINKKAQVSIFIIIAIVIVVAVGGYFILKNYTSDVEVDDVDLEIQEINSFVKSCIALTGEDAIYHVGSTGGYIVPPENSLVIDYGDNYTEEIAYYLYEETNNMPSKEVIESEISLYMNSLFAFCINDFNAYPEYEIIIGDLNTETKIEKDRVVFNVAYDLSIMKNGVTYQLKEFKEEVLVRLGELHDIISQIMADQMEKTDSICMTCLNEVSDKNNIKVMMSDGGEGIVFAIVDEKSKIYGNSYEFYFANKYKSVE